MKKFIITLVLALVAFVSFNTTADAQAKSIGDVLEEVISSSPSTDTTMLKNIKVEADVTSTSTISLTYPSPYTAKEMLVFAKSAIYDEDVKYFETDDLCKMVYKDKGITCKIVVKDNKFKIAYFGEIRYEFEWLVAFVTVQDLAHRLTQGIAKDYDF